ncbi:MAG: response regulator [Planctomycetota bacterium]|nr:MAG: response regulator [Planctomycetota bacterium]
MDQIPTHTPDLAEGLAECRPTILLVDDNEQNLELLQAYLEDLPCKVQVARDGVEALEQVKALDPDLVVLDVMMPRMSGFQVCERIKGDPATREIPVVMVTALNEVGDVERAVDAGTDDFLTKPVNRLELVTRVTSLLRVRQLKRQLDNAVRMAEDMRRQEG